VRTTISGEKYWRGWRAFGRTRRTIVARIRKAATSGSRYLSCVVSGGTIDGALQQCGIFIPAERE
jgi:hypothetical protein